MSEPLALPDAAFVTFLPTSLLAIDSKTNVLKTFMATGEGGEGLLERRTGGLQGRGVLKKKKGGRAMHDTSMINVSDGLSARWHCS